MTVEDFVPPFGGKLDAENRWIKMAELMPWDMIESIYEKTFKSENNDGRPPITSRMAFGSLFIKENENFPQERTMQHISENVYMQYFLGLTEFNPKPLFDSSMLSRIAARSSKEDMKRNNEEIYRRTRPKQEEPPKEEPPEDGGGDNKGTMVLDATVAPADIRYPTDLSLLNECRESSEKIIDDVWEETERKGHKTAYNRNKIRKEYLNVTKQRRPRKSRIKKAVRIQLECVEKNVAKLEGILETIGLESFGMINWAKLQMISQIAKQQRFHYENPREPIPDRIVSLSQPHVRPIVRGKARSDVEFGQKLSLSIVDEFTFIENQSWNNFAEGVTLKESAEKFKKMHGVYPKAILADKTYRNRENIRFCKENGIRLSGPRLGRPKASEIEADKEQAYKDSCKRNIVEGRIGVSKRRYGLDLIYARFGRTGEVEAAMNVICMNVAHVLRVLLRYFIWWQNWVRSIRFYARFAVS
jgi:archaellum component FlaC